MVFPSQEYVADCYKELEDETYVRSDHGRERLRSCIPSEAYAVSQEAAVESLLPESWRSDTEAARKEVSDSST